MIFLYQPPIGGPIPVFIYVHDSKGAIVADLKFQNLVMVSVNFFRWAIINYTLRGKKQIGVIEKKNQAIECFIRQKSYEKCSQLSYIYIDIANFSLGYIIPSRGQLIDLCLTSPIRVDNLSTFYLSEKSNLTQNKKRSFFDFATNRILVILLYIYHSFCLKEYKKLLIKPLNNSLILSIVSLYSVSQLD